MSFSSWTLQEEGIGGGTSTGPSLAVFQNRLYAAWKGAGADERMFWSSFDVVATPLSLLMLDRISEIEVTGEGFTDNSGIQIFYGYETFGGGVQINAFGELATSADQDGHFEGMVFSLPGNNFNIGARAVDVATGRDVVAPILRPEV